MCVWVVCFNLIIKKKKKGGGLVSLFLNALYGAKIGADKTHDDNKEDTYYYAAEQMPFPKAGFRFWCFFF